MKIQKMHRMLTLALTLCLSLLFSSPSFGGPSFENKDIIDVGWSVEYIGSIYDDRTDTTIFTYRMTVDDWEKDLSHWVLVMDSEGETPAVSGTNTSFGLDPTTGVWGVKWDNGQDSGTTMDYTITVNGNVGEADTQYSVKGGTYFAIGETTGPGESVTTESDMFSISGIAYVDANGNGMLDEDEPRLSNVSVDLYDANDVVISSIITDADGAYTFEDLQQDYYSLNIVSSSMADDFNEILAAYLNRVNPEPIYVNLFTADSSDNNFGFGIQVSTILDDLNPADVDNDGVTLLGTGKTIGFWKHQHNVAIRGKGRAQVDADTLLGYLNTIEGLFLVDPFLFDDSDEFASAITILSSTSSDEVDLLSKQLLGTELNHISGRGLSGEYMSLQSVLIAWSEYLVKNSVLFDRKTLLEAKDVCDLINNSGE